MSVLAWTSWEILDLWPLPQAQRSKAVVNIQLEQKEVAETEWDGDKSSFLPAEVQETPSRLLCFDIGQMPGTHKSCLLTLSSYSWAEERKNN